MNKEGGSVCVCVEEEVERVRAQTGDRCNQRRCFLLFCFVFSFFMCQAKKVACFLFLLLLSTCRSMLLLLLYVDGGMYAYCIELL